MALNTPAIATAIAALTVSGVTIKNITTIPKAIKKADCPIFFPHPEDWEQGLESLTGNAFVGQAGVFDVVHHFRYIYLHGLSIAANPMSSIYSAMAGKADLIVSALESMNANSGVLTVTSVRRSRFGEIAAPAAGNTSIRDIFYGCFFEIDIQEMSTS
jgi:hypothetical protein